MKTIGLIGGMSWESSREYYRYLNEMVKEKLGEPHSCSCILYSLDFAEIKELQHRGSWQQLAAKMVEAARNLEQAGAGLILICANTMHKLAPEVEKSLQVPLVHIADAAAAEIKNLKLNRVGLLGTRFTMEEDFYRKRLEKKHGMEIIVPEKAEMEEIHSIIYQELISGIIKKSSRNKLLRIIEDHPEVEGVILGCTELPLLLEEDDLEIPLFDTMKLHAGQAVKLALKQDAAQAWDY